jgi:hypothetical protein
LFAFYWLPLATDLNNFAGEVVRPALEIRGKPGTRVRGFAPATFMIPSSGALFLDVPIPATFSWEATHWKYMPLRGVLLSDKEDIVLQLPQKRFFHFSLDASLYQNAFFDFWLTFYPKPYGWSFSLGAQQQKLGIALSHSTTPLETSFNELPLVMPGVMAAYHFRQSTRESVPVPQLYLSAAVLARYNYELSALDDFSPFNSVLAAGYEWLSPMHIRFFAEVGMAFYLLGGEYKSSLSKGQNDDHFEQIIVGLLYIEFPTVRIGVKLPIPL